MVFKNCKEKYYLECLWNGLEYIYKQIQLIEEDQRKKLCKTRSGEVHSLLFNDINQMPEHHMIINYFIWYACSLIVFLKLFKKSYALSKDWQKEFSSEIKWRNKVAAHTAYTDPNENDNKYSQEISIHMSPGWRDDSFIVGGDIIGDVDGISYTDWSWSITKTHEKLKDFVASRVGCVRQKGIRKIKKL